MSDKNNPDPNPTDNPNTTSNSHNANTDTSNIYSPNVNNPNDGISNAESQNADDENPNVHNQNADMSNTNSANADRTNANSVNADSANANSSNADIPNAESLNFNSSNTDNPHPEGPSTNTPNSTPDEKEGLKKVYIDTSHSQNPDKNTIDNLDELSWTSSDIELDADMLEAVLFYVGDMGIYQKWLFVWMMPFATFFAWSYFVQMFITLTPQNYWCKVPELANLSAGVRRNLSAPVAPNGQWDSCHTYDTNWTKVLDTLKPPPQNTSLIACKDGWEYEDDVIPYDTVVSERGWVCDSATYVPTTHSMFFAGSMTSGIIFGWIADHFGRIPALMGVNIIGGIGGVASIFTQGDWDFIFCRYLVGIAFDNCFMIIYILVLEYVGPSNRTWMANLPLAFYHGAAAVAIPWMAYYIADWRKLVLVTSVPMFIVILAPWVMPESARWLVSRGKVFEAAKELEKFAKVNRNQIPTYIMDKFIEKSLKISEQKKETISILLKNRLVRSAIVIMFCTYGGLAVVYDGLVRLSESFGHNVFVTFTINAAAEIPSILVLTVLLDRVGRRNLTWGPAVIAALFMIIAMVVPSGIIQIFFAVLARFLINLAFNVVVQWGTEILPTPFRATGSCALHVYGFGLSLLSPFIVFSRKIWASLPLLIMIIISLTSAIMSLLLPETKGLGMPQTISDAEKIVGDRSLRGKPEVKDLKKALSNVLSTAVADPVRLSKEGRVSRIIISKSRSRLNIQSN